MGLAWSQGRGRGDDLRRAERLTRGEGLTWGQRLTGDQGLVGGQCFVGGDNARGCKGLAWRKRLTGCQRLGGHVDLAGGRLGWGEGLAWGEGLTGCKRLRGLRRRNKNRRGRRGRWRGKNLNNDNANVAVSQELEVTATNCGNTHCVRRCCGAEGLGVDCALERDCALSAGGGHDADRVGGFNGVDVNLVLAILRTNPLERNVHEALVEVVALHRQGGVGVLFELLDGCGGHGRALDLVDLHHPDTDATVEREVRGLGRVEAADVGQTHGVGVRVLVQVRRDGAGDRGATNRGLERNNNNRRGGERCVACARAGCAQRGVGVLQRHVQGTVREIRRRHS
eukprot:PhM_4_TR1283/c1_g1_i2/m.7328